MNLKKRMKYKVCVRACVGVGGWVLKLFSHMNWKIRLGHCLKMSFLTNPSDVLLYWFGPRRTQTEHSLAVNSSDLCSSHMDTIGHHTRELDS